MSILTTNFTPRLYQEKIFSTTTAHNTLVVLPTGLGKTAIAAMLAAHKLEQQQGKIVFLAPTKPLVQQHLDTFKELFNLPEKSFALFTGAVSPEKRMQLWEQAQIIFSTPQGMENDVISRKISLKDVSLLIFDEAHRATGDYAYNYIAKTYHEQATRERILALTASPGSDETTIKAVCENLFIEEIEVRSTTDADVKQYVQELDIIYKEVVLTDDIIIIKRYLQKSYDQKIAEAKTLGVIEHLPNLNKSTLLKLQGAMHAKTAQGERSYEVLKTISLLAEALKVQHALELIETQTIKALLAYLEQLQAQARKSKSKAVQNIAKDINIKSAHIIAEKLVREGKEHPKISVLKELITKEFISNQHKKIIIFTQFRDTAVTIQENLQEIAASHIFVGQAKKGTTGLTQKKQKEMIDSFRQGEFPILIATSVAEEGLDIPSVDTVIFYEPIPSAIRTVQRRGRTGRHDSGNVFMLIAKNTRDEGYRWSAHHKEKRMYRTIAHMKKTFTPTQKEQTTLTNYNTKDKFIITVDYREKGSAVMKSLLQQNVKLDLQQLSIGDYKISDDVVIEYKTVKDFVDSIIDGRLLGQLSALRSTYKPIIIIEGQEDMYAQRRINPAAIRGMLATIILSYHIPVLRTSSPADTAGVLLALAKRVAGSEERTFNTHHVKPWTQQEQQEYLVASLPGIGPKLAKPLLQQFSTIKKLVNASLEELQEVELIGKKKAEAIKELLDAEY